MKAMIYVRSLVGKFAVFCKGLSKHVEGLIPMGLSCLVFISAGLTQRHFSCQTIHYKAPSTTKHLLKAAAFHKN